MDPRMDAELGLFPLETVLLPSERVPLHIFELRYQELIGECLAESTEFGLVLEDSAGLCDVGTRTAVIDIFPTRGWQDRRALGRVAGGSEKAANQNTMF